METKEFLLERREELETEYQKLEEYKRIINNKIRKIASMDSKEKRNERNRRLFVKGGMVEMILGETMDEEFFIGCLLEIKKVEVGGKSFLMFKESGKRYFKENKKE